MATPGARPVEETTLAHLRAAAGRLLPRYPEVIAAYLFGSAARGEPAGDLDVALAVLAPPSTARLETLAANLQAEGAPNGPMVDLRPLWGSAPRFRATVISEGRLLDQASAERRIEYEARSLGEWLDFKPTWQRMRRSMFDRWARG
jgi:predicted nucleotidyltransferase